MAQIRVRVHRDEAGEWRWTRWSGSDIVADSAEGYANHGHAVEMAIKHNPGADIIIEKEDPSDLEA